MNDPNENIDPEEIRDTARVLGEFPDVPENKKEGEADSTTARVARLVEEAYEREPEYRLTEAQRQLILGGASALRAVPALNERNRKSFVIAAASGLAVAACFFFLLVLWPSAPEPAGNTSGVAAFEPDLEEGVVMRVQILEKPLEVASPKNPEDESPLVEEDLVIVQVEDGEKKNPDPSIAEDPETPVPVVATRKSLDDWMRLIAANDGESDVTFNFEKAVAGLRENTAESAGLPRWRLVDCRSAPELDEAGVMMQRLVFRGPVPESPAMLVALTFDSESVARFRPAQRNEWTEGGRELVMEIPDEAVGQGHWELLLEVEPLPVAVEYDEENRPDPRRLGSSLTPVVGDVVVAGDTDQAASRIKLNGEMKMSSGLRAELALSRFARWAAAPDDLSPADLLEELRTILGEGDLEELLLKGLE